MGLLAVRSEEVTGAATEAMAVTGVTGAEAAPVERVIFAVICGAPIRSVNVWEGICVHAYKKNLCNGRRSPYGGAECGIVVDRSVYSG